MVLNISNENYSKYQSYKQDIGDIKRIKTEEIMLGSKSKLIGYGERLKILFELGKNVIRIQNIFKNF